MRLRGASWLWKGSLGLTLSLLIFGGSEVALHWAIPESEQPKPLDRFALADVGAGAYVHRRDAAAGPWLESQGGRVRTRSERLPEGIAPLDVPSEPTPGRMRVVALGGSTTRGIPFDHVGGGFVSQIAGWSQHPMEVINLGVPGMDARGVAVMAREARALQPDIFVVYTGNNEVVGDLLDHCVRPGRVWVSGSLDRLVLYRLLRRALLGEPTKPGSSEALSAQQACMDARVAEAWATGRASRGPLLRSGETPVYLPGPRRDVAASETRARLTDALTRLAVQAAQEDVDVVLVKPARNLLYAPERPLGAPGSTAETAAAVDAILHDPRTHGSKRWTRALLLDAHRADVLHGWGRTVLSEGGEPARAAQALQAAIDHDYSARRPTSGVLSAMERACAQWSHFTCVDAHDALVRQAGTPVLPEAWFHDHCHPSEEGYARIARVVADSVDSVLGGSRKTQ